MDALDTLYRRPLPEELVAFSSPTGRGLFREALAAGGMEGYFPLAEQFHTQSDPAFCGLGSLVVALNALGIDPGRLWKGPWRWYSEELLDCCVDLEDIRGRGVTLDELACLAVCNGAHAEVRRADETGVAELRAAIDAAAAGDGSVVIAAYDRAGVGQTGAGHYSPVAGLHRGRDLALVLDVARFKYPPHWVPVERLHAAMQSADAATGRARGWVVLRRRPGGGALWSLTSRASSWRALLEHIDRAASTDAPGVDPVVAVIAAIAAATPALVVRHTEEPAHAALAARVEAQLAATAAYARVATLVATPALVAPVAALLLMSGPRIAARVPEARRAALAALLELAALPAELAAEIGHVRNQLAALTEAPALALGDGCRTC